MTLQLPADLETLVQSQIASGAFADVDAVMRAALESLVERQAVADDLHASLEDVHAGRILPLDSVVAEIRARHGWAS